MLEQILGLVIVVGIGLICGWRPTFGVGGFFELVGLVLLGLMAFTWLGVLIGMVFRSSDAMQGVGFSLVFPLSFLAGTFVPIQGMALVPRVIGEWDPIAALVASVRKVCQGTPARARGCSSTRRSPWSAGACSSSPCACRWRCAGSRAADRLIRALSRHSPRETHLPGREPLMRRTPALGTVAVAALLATSCTWAKPTAKPAPQPSHGTTHGRATSAGLARFGDCTALTRAMRTEALGEVTAYGLPGAGTGYGLVDDIGVRQGGPVGDLAFAGAGTGTTGGGATMRSAQGSAVKAAAPGPAQGFSGTNNQEAGVDEPDLVKTDGTLMLVLRRGTSRLQAIDVTGTPRVLSHLKVDLPQIASLLLSGHTAVVLGERFEGRQQVTTAEVYDVSDGSAMRHVRTFRVDGALLDARFVHGRILLVTQSAPVLPWAYPGGAVTQEDALQKNQALIRSADAQQWLPTVRVTPQLRSYHAQCDATYHPAARSGTSTTSIVTLDPEASAPTGNLTVVGGSSVMYASEDALYLATTSWADQQSVYRGDNAHVTTQLHGFGIADPDQITTLGSGTVPGTLTDQYALSEDKGYLRVASTIGTPRPPNGEGVAPDRSQLSDNLVTVLKPTAGVLAKVGELRGLGRGERIYGVRFLGDVGYVVTFRTIDPLYALDLSDPRHPAARGALHITGYSSALFPLADGQLLGVGQSVGDHQQQLGAQAEVFDVRDLDKPALTGKKVWPTSMSPAQDDHHALLWWAPKRLVVMPLMGYGYGQSGAVVLKVGTDGSLTETGRITSNRGQINRAVVVGDLLYSVTDDGLVVAPLDNLDAQTWLPFA